MNRISAGVFLAGVLSLLAACGSTTGVRPSSASCDLTINPGSQSAPPAGGSFRAAVASTCAWTATTNDSWIAIGNGQGSGAGSFTYTVLPNRGETVRRGRVSVAELALVVTQEAAQPEEVPPPAPAPPPVVPPPAPAPTPAP